MDIVEFLETQYGCELLEYQKTFLRDMYKVYKERGDLRIVMRRNNGQYDFYTYLKQNNLPIAKELLSNGTTIDCNK